MRIATLFSGIGAPEQAAKRVYGDDFEIVFACEFDKFARKSYLANCDINEDHFHKDVNDLDATRYRGNVDVLIGGSPCQSFSIAGLRKGTKDERGGLIYEYIRVVDECRPEVIVYENVKGILSIDNGKTIKEFVQALRDIGYHCHYEVVNTKDYGVPQNRERLFLVGFIAIDRYFRFSFGETKQETITLCEILESGNGFVKKWQNKKDGFIISKISSTIRASGTCSRKLPRVLLADGKEEKLTPRECLRLQDFPDDFKIVVSDTQAYKQAGNSMSVNVVEMIFRQIEKTKEPSKNNLLGFCA